MTAPAVAAATRVDVAELVRLRAVEAAAAELVRKLDEHERRGYGHIRVGAIRPLRDALTGGAR